MLKLFAKSAQIKGIAGILKQEVQKNSGSLYDAVVESMKSVMRANSILVMPSVGVLRVSKLANKPIVDRAGNEYYVPPTFRLEFKPYTKLIDKIKNVDNLEDRIEKGLKKDLTPEKKKSLKVLRDRRAEQRKKSLQD